MRQLSTQRVLVLILSIGVSLMIGGVIYAQDDTTADAEGTQNTINYFFAACENQAIFNLDGFMNPGFDVYVEVTRDSTQAGEALTNQVRVQVDGNYQVSPQLPYLGGASLLLGQFASAEISIAPEGRPQDAVFSDVITDTQDGCIEPAYGSADTSDTGTTGSPLLIDPRTGNVISSDSVEAGNIIESSGIFTPDGGVLNEVVARTPEPLVQIGARPSETAAQLPERTSDPGLIFAECNKFPLADPGLLFDTDTLVIFWSWFAATPELVRDHIANANYEVFLFSEYASRQPFPLVNRSPVVRREDGNYYVFYTANLGDSFRPGNYSVTYYLTWDTVIDDGYELFGPGTENPEIASACDFEVQINPFGVRTDLDNPTTPLQRNN